MRIVIFLLIVGCIVVGIVAGMIAFLAAPQELQPIAVRPLVVSEVSPEKLIKHGVEWATSLDPQRHETELSGPSLYSTELDPPQEATESIIFSWFKLADPEDAEASRSVVVTPEAGDGRISLEGKDGPQIMEVNSSPGLEGIERCTQLDIAGSIVDYIAAQVDFPEIDLRQRLTVSRGYGVTEIHIPEGSEFVGKSISESGLRERDLNVLTLRRGSTTIPNPKPSRALEPSDLLLCFGKLELMRDLIPRKTRRRRKPAVQELPELPVAEEVMQHDVESDTSPQPNDD